MALARQSPLFLALVRSASVTGWTFQPSQPLAPRPITHGYLPISLHFQDRATPLSLATLEGHTDTVRMLLRVEGIDASKPNKASWQSALGLAHGCVH